MQSDEAFLKKPASSGCGSRCHRAQSQRSHPPRQRPHPAAARTGDGSVRTRRRADAAGPCDHRPWRQFAVSWHGRQDDLRGGRQAGLRGVGDTMLFVNRGQTPGSRQYERGRGIVRGLRGRRRECRAIHRPPQPAAVLPSLDEHQLAGPRRMPVRRLPSGPAARSIVPATGARRRRDREGLWRRGAEGKIEAVPHP